MEKLNFLKHINSHTHIKKLLKTEIGALLLTRFSVFFIGERKYRNEYQKISKSISF